VRGIRHGVSLVGWAATRQSELETGSDGLDLDFRLRVVEAVPSSDPVDSARHRAKFCRSVLE
jgi:hypothetical protein